MSKQDNEQVQITLELQYGQMVPKSHFFGDEREMVYERFPTVHADHREFLAIAGLLEAAAREHHANWSMERIENKSKDEGDIRARFAELGKAHYDGGYANLLFHIGTLTSTLAIGATLLKAVQPSMVQWLKNRASTTLRVKVGDTEIAIKGQQDFDRAAELLQKVSAIKQTKSTKKKKATGQKGQKRARSSQATDKQGQKRARSSQATDKQGQKRARSSQITSKKGAKRSTLSRAK